MAEAPTDCAVLSESAGVVPRPLAGLVVTGADAPSYLHGQLSADVEALVPGDSVETLILTPQGRVIAVGTLVAGVEASGGDGFELIVDAGVAHDTRAALERFLIRVDVEIAQSERAWHHVAGPRAAEAADGADAAVAYPGPLGGLLATGPIDAPEVSAEAFAARRVEAGEALVGIDIGEKTIPHEAGLVPRAVSLDKGCYTGQELIERIHTRGHPNRALRAVRIGAADVPVPGSEVISGGKAVGVLTTTAVSCIWGQPAGLGLIRREIESGTEVEVSGSPGVVYEVPVEG